MKPNGFSLIFKYLFFLKKPITVFFKVFSTGQSRSKQQSHSEFRMIQSDEMMTVLQAWLSGSYPGISDQVSAFKIGDKDRINFQ